MSRLSYSGLEAYRRCPYRFYLERSLGLAAGRPARARESARRPPGLSALLRGSLVHLLLEELDFERPRVPDAESVAALIERHGVPVREERRGRPPRDGRALRRLGRCARASPRRAGCARELPFAFTLEPPGAGGRRLVVNGVVDVHATEPDGVLVVDYKSDALEGRDPEELCARAYATQRLVYGAGDAPRRRRRAWWWRTASSSGPTTRRSSSTPPRTPPDLEAQLLEVARGVVEARFEPTDDPHRELCADCPGRAALCSWGPERTLAEPAVR